MKLVSLELSNFKGIKSAKFELDEKSTVFFGINGVGKSSVLRGINLLYSRIINKVVKNRFKQGINIELSDISFGAQECKIQALLKFPDGSVEQYHRAMERKNSSRVHSGNSLDLIYAHFEKECFGPQKDMPIFVNYGVNRLVLDVPVRIRTKHTFDKEAAFEKAIENRIDFRTFFEWFRHQEDFENQKKVRESNRYEDISLKAVRTAILNMFEGFSNLRIERSPLSMKINKGKTALSIEQLSDGEKCTLALIGDLARRLSLANPENKNPLHGTGVVLIDEIELHMHPTWQREILPKLKKTFPNIQFIITTHSPQVLGEVDDSFNIYSLSIVNDELTYSKTVPLLGWDTNYILEDFMGSAHLNLGTKELIRSMYTDYERGDYASAEKKALKLGELTNPAHEDVVKINILLGRVRDGA